MVGASLAVALGSAGVSCVLIDRADPAAMADAAYDSRTTAIAHGSKMALDAIGAWSGMAADAAPILDIRISDGAAPLYLHFDHAAVGDAPMGYIVENQVIRRALYDRLGGLGSVTLCAPATVDAMEVTEGGISLRLDHRRGRWSAGLLVGADGAASPLREQAGIRCTRWQYKQAAIVCNMRHERRHRGIAHERFLPAGPFAVLPMTDAAAGHHRSSIVWDRGQRDGARIPGARRCSLLRRAGAVGSARTMAPSPSTVRAPPIRSACSMRSGTSARAWPWSAMPPM